jgi:tetratricopeptide (TPR) repeat protein
MSKIILGHSVAFALALLANIVAARLVTQGRWTKRAQIMGLVVAALIALALALEILLNAENEWWISLAIIAGVMAVGVWLACVYFYFSKHESPLVPSRLIPRFPQTTRRRALLGIGAIPLAVLIGIGVVVWWMSQPPSTFVILVADFDGPNPQSYRVGELIRSGLREALATQISTGRVSVQAAPMITEQEGSEAARALGDPWGTRNDAGIVIWGWYGVTEERSVVFPQLEIIRKPGGLSPIEVDGQLVDRSRMESFSIQMELSSEMTYLAGLIVGLAELNSGNYEEAERSFTLAIAEASQRQPPPIELGVLYYYRGDTYLLRGDAERGGYDYHMGAGFDADLAEIYFLEGMLAYDLSFDCPATLDRMHAVIELDRTNLEAYLYRGLAYECLGDPESAEMDFMRVLAAPDAEESLRESAREHLDRLRRW